MSRLDRTELYFAYFAYEPHDQSLRLRCGVWRDTEGSSLEARSADAGPWFKLGEERGFVGRVAKTAEAVYVPDTRVEEQWIDGVGVLSAFFVPLASEGPCDVLVLLSHELDGFDEGERALVLALVSYLSRALGGDVRPELRIHRLERGLRRIALELAELGFAGAQGSPVYPTALVERLRLVSPREWQVLERLRSGLRVATIARELRISPNTVRNHLKSIYRKLGVRSQTELLEKLQGAEVQPGQDAA